MSNAITRARELRQQADRLKNRQADEAKAQHFEKRRNELVELRKRLEEFALPADVLARDGRIPPEDFPDSAEVEALLSKLLLKARQEAPEDFSKGNDYSRFRKRLDAMNSELESLVDKVWKEFLAEFPPVDEKLLDDLTTIPGQEQAVKQVRLLKSELQIATARPPKVDDELKAILKRAEALRAKLADLSDAHYPIPVRQFLRAAQQPGGAELGLLTDDVRQWLKARGLIDRIRLRWIEVPGGRRP